MGPFAAYSFSAGIYLLAAYLAYKCLLSRENQPGFNRVTLLAIYLLAALLPLVHEVQLIPIEESSGAGEGIIIAAGVAAVGHFNWVRPLLWIYLAGMTCAFAATVVSLVRLAAVIRSGRHIQVGDYVLILLPDNRYAPFSFWRYIVMSETDYTESGAMIECHEDCHLRLRHWIDLLIAQLCIIILWYNPASWLMRAELRAVHEYQADKCVIGSGVDAREYQLLLIKKAVGEKFQSLANSLNHSKLKNRITMMCNHPSEPRRRLRALALAPALLAAAIVVNAPAVASALSTTSSTSLTDDKDKNYKSEWQDLRVDSVSTVPIDSVREIPVYAVPSEVNNPTILVDGKVYNGFIQDIDPNKIESITVWKDNPSYPNGVVDIKMKKD